MRISEVAVRNPGEYVYHASHVARDKASLFRSLLKYGLKPSTRGISGPGVYFAYDPEGGYYHVGPEDSVILRVKWQDLIDLYGLYPENPKGIQRDNAEIIVPGVVPAKFIEVEYFPDEWWTLDQAQGAETYHR